MNSEKPRVVGGVIIWIQWQGLQEPVRRWLDSGHFPGSPTSLQVP